MSKSTQAKRFKALGMPYSKSQHILRKKLFHHMVKELNRDICFRCGKIIETPDELSIDHKIDWLASDRSVELFYDVSNISFSHSLCNTKAPRPSAPKSKMSQSRGVYWRKERRKWIAVIWQSGKRKWLGAFSSVDDATAAYQAAVAK